MTTDRLGLAVDLVELVNRDPLVIEVDQPGRCFYCDVELYDWVQLTLVHEATCPWVRARRHLGLSLLHHLVRVERDVVDVDVRSGVL